MCIRYLHDSEEFAKLKIRYGPALYYETIYLWNELMDSIREKKVR